MRRLSLLAVVFAAPAFAQPGAVEPFAQTAAPFIDEHTLLVVRIDVTRLDAGAIAKLAVSVLGDGEDADATGPAVTAWIKETGKRAADVFLTYGPGDFPNTPSLMARAPADETAQLELARLLSVPLKKAGVDVEWATRHGCVCVGTKDGLAVIKERKPVARPDLVAALEVGKEAAAQVAFAPSAEARKIYEQIAPTLPADLGGGSIHKITRGLKWAAIAIGHGPKMPAELAIEATSANAANELKGLEGEALEMSIGHLFRDDRDTDSLFRARLKAAIDRRTTTVTAARLTTKWELGTILLDAVKGPAGQPADRVRSVNNMKQLLLALHNYHDVHGRFPADVRDKDGNPLLSWRVLILPYIEQTPLYNQFRLTEPWNSDHNKKLAAQMPKLFRCPRQADALKDRTTYLAPLGKGFIWDDPKGIKIFEIADGTSNTIALVEAEDERAVIWSKPEDVSIDTKSPTTGLLGHYGDGFNAAMADGSVRFFKKTIEPKTLWALFTRDGGETIAIPK